MLPPAGRLRHQGPRRALGRWTTAALAVALTSLAACQGAPRDEVPTGTLGGTAPGDTVASTPGGMAGGTSSGGTPSGSGTATSGSPTSHPGDSGTTTTAAPTVAELPRGGTEIFPTYRLFGYSGAPLSEGLGRLGIGDLDDRVVEMEERGQEFAGGRELLPVLELIATVVHAVPGDDGMYRTHMEDDVVRDYLEAARRHDGILLLNIQPGRADFIDEVKYWEDWLSEPDVGVALDPEWAVGEGQTPGRVYGRTTGKELDEVAAYLADLVEEHHLPEKVMVYHQVHKSVVRDEHELTDHEGVVIIKSVDGIGSPYDKELTYDLVNENRPDFVHPGFKLFYVEDAAVGPLMTAEQVLALKPRPEYILFE